MSWNILIFLFSTLLLISSSLSTVDINTATDSELKLSENTAQSTGSLAEFASTMFELLYKLGRRLPTGKADDIYIVKNVDDPRFKYMIEGIEESYKNLTQFVPKDDNGNTYNFITDMRNFSIELYKSKNTIEEVEKDSPDYQRVQEYFKSEFVKLVGRFTNHMIDLGERYFNSLTAEKRIADQKAFNDKLKEIKTETDVEEKFESLFILLQDSNSEFKKSLKDTKI